MVWVCVSPWVFSHWNPNPKVSVQLVPLWEWPERFLTSYITRGYNEKGTRLSQSVDLMATWLWHSRLSELWNNVFVFVTDCGSHGLRQESFYFLLDLLSLADALGSLLRVVSMCLAPDLEWVRSDRDRHSGFSILPCALLTRRGRSLIASSWQFDKTCWQDSGNKLLEMASSRGCVEVTVFVLLMLPLVFFLSGVECWN